jgi:osmotically-inducible protein OsmY
MRFSIWLYLALNLGFALVGCTAQQQQQTQTDAKQATLIPQVMAKLVAVDVDAATSVRVAQDHGVIILTGQARTATERDQYVRAAGSVDGVASVRDQLAINPRVQGAREDAQDAALAVRVSATIAAQAGVNALHVTPSVHQGVVALSGSVPNRATAQAIVQAVRGVPGVKSVVDRIAVGPSQS